MKALIFFISLFFISSLQAVTQFNWEVIRQDEDSSFWKDKDKAKSYVSITSNKQRGRTPTKLDDLIEKRKKMLVYSGISKWKVTKKSKTYQKNKEITLFTFYGQYKDHKGDLNYFLEIHKYNGKKVIQYLMTSQGPFKPSEEYESQILELYE